MIGGGVIAAGELLLDAGARVIAQPRARASRAQHVAVRAARFGAEAGMLGAALLRARAGRGGGCAA